MSKYSNELKIIIIYFIFNVDLSITDAGKLILLFEDLEMYSRLECKKEYLYCTYPPVKIV